MMIRQNTIQNPPVSIDDIEIVEKIFVPGVSTLKVRTTRQRPKVVVGIFIEIQRELIENNQKLIICMDVIFINQQALLTTSDKDTRFHGLVPLANKTK